MGPSDHAEGVTTPGYRLITASAAGSLFRWEGRNFRSETTFTSNGDFPVSAIAATGNTLQTSRLVAGNTEGTIKVIDRSALAPHHYPHPSAPPPRPLPPSLPSQVFDKSMKLIANYNLENLSPALFETPPDDWKRHIRSIDIFGGRILVGTKGSDIFEIRAPSQIPSDGLATDEKILNLHHGPLVQGHYKHELRGLAFPPPPRSPPDAPVPDPFQDLFATSGDDGGFWEGPWSSRARRADSPPPPPPPPSPPLKAP